MSNDFIKCSFLFKKEYAEQFESFFPEEFLLQAVVEDYELLMEEIDNDSLALPNNLTLKEGEVRYSFFFETEKKANDFVENMKEKISFPIKIENNKIKIYLFPKIIDISKQFVVVFEEKMSEYKGKKEKIVLSSSQIFGTGEHPTTRLMFEFMEKENFNNKIIIDAGAGSLVLSIGAKKLGAKSVFAFDIADNFLKIAKKNMKLNNCDIDLTQGDEKIFMKKKEFWKNSDIFLCNMLPKFSLPLIKHLLPFLPQKTIYILSGFPKSHITEYMHFFEKNGLKILEQLQKDEWLGFKLQKI